MRNMNLLRFLAAVQVHSTTTKGLMTTSGYDPLELQIAVRVAQRAGFVEDTGVMQPSIRLTAAGRAWAVEQLAEFAPLAIFATHGRRVA